jgi:hypothetical protein
MGIWIRSVSMRFHYVQTPPITEPLKRAQRKRGVRYTQENEPDPKGMEKKKKNKILPFNQIS